MTDRYAVWGHPIAHSQSPFIHAEFARVTHQDMAYGALLGDLERFEEQVQACVSEGYRGFNVTLPFKTRALTLATTVSEAARIAEASNTLVVTPQGIEAHNTDGVGLLRDLHRLAIPLKGVSVLIIGAGGATRGILAPLMKAGARITLVNRTESRAQALVERFNALDAALPLRQIPWSELSMERPEVLINATSTGTLNEPMRLPAALFEATVWAYDLAYTASGDTPFLLEAKAHGLKNFSDGLGMLVEQAAEAFYIWRGVLPPRDSVREALRSRLRAIKAE